MGKEDGGGIYWGGPRFGGTTAPTTPEAQPPIDREEFIKSVVVATMGTLKRDMVQEAAAIAAGIAFDRLTNEEGDN